MSNWKGRSNRGGEQKKYMLLPSYDREEIACWTVLSADLEAGRPGAN